MTSFAIKNDCLKLIPGCYKRNFSAKKVTKYILVIFTADLIIKGSDQNFFAIITQSLSNLAKVRLSLQRHTVGLARA